MWSPGDGRHCGLKQKPKSPEAHRGEDWRAMGPLLFPGNVPSVPLLSRDPCRESLGNNVATRMARAPLTNWRIPKVFRDSLGEAEGMRDTTDGAGHRIPAIKVWVA